MIRMGYTTDNCQAIDLGCCELVQVSLIRSKRIFGDVGSNHEILTTNQIDGVTIHMGMLPSGYD